MYYALNRVWIYDCSPSEADLLNLVHLKSIVAVLNFIHLKPGTICLTMCRNLSA